ncbi:axin isoform X3 [Cimex lectularius]|uniref:Axin n=1 Tax=Cimex lectularius TaxID=79782 RepID=A0A8I6SUL5_CIMLE|nr:axin isoform X3 [Cimex lectularius]
MSMFHHNAPRPPVVPGEETEGIENKIVNVGVVKAHNPALTPRTSSLYQHSINDGIAPLGFEPEGSSGSPHCGEQSSMLCGDIRPHCGNHSPPGYLKWARNLPSLLADPAGVELFRQYLHQEGKSHSDALDFWFACEGLHKQSDPDRVTQFVKVIYRRFFIKTQLMGISESHRKAVHRRLKDSNSICDKSVFDSTQAQIEALITETTYPNFLKSELYLNHVQSMQNGSGESSGSSEQGMHSGANPLMLATLHEDQILDTSANPSFGPLTKDMLIFTQRRRASETSKPEVFAGMFLYPGKAGPGRAYSSYNPVSRQDSELQSLSSDARTESDNMSLTDSSVDGRPFNAKMTRKQFQKHCRQVKESANLNRDPYMHHIVIPRTQRMQKDQVHPMKPERFAAILIEKLESVKRSQDVQEKLAHKLLEAEDGAPSAKSLADAIRERFQVEDDNDQDILDQHVSRVWSDQTPSRTPGLTSPRPKSPDPLRRNRAVPPTINKICVSGGGSAMAVSYSQNPYTISHPYQARLYNSRHVRKDKDIFSTFSSDSGNVHDFPESIDQKLHMPKSKSMPDYAESTDSSLPSHDGRFIRGSREWFASSRKYNKKPELTDSGVSVVSESASSHSALLSNKDNRVMSWLIESDRTGCCSHSERDSERASSCSGGSRYDGKHHARPNPVRSPPSGPAQPFIADPSMPPLPSPHTPTQLDEARRRLEDQARCKQNRQSFRCVQMGKAEPPLSGTSTLRKPKSSDMYTTVVFSFCDEQFPYRTKIPGHSITLKQFKEFLPKKGNYRYFFKTECEDLDVRVIQEEITDDSEVLPLWEGKVMAQVKPLE